MVTGFFSIPFCYFAMQCLRAMESTENEENIPSRPEILNRHRIFIVHEAAKHLSVSLASSVLSIWWSPA